MLWLLEEPGVDYSIELFQRDAKTLLAPPELTAVHPLGKSPVITDGKQTLAESGAIIEYLNDAYGAGRFAPVAASPDWLRYRCWMHYAEGLLMPLLLMKLVFDRIAKAQMPFFAKPVAKAIADRAKKSFVMPQIERHLDFLEAELGKSEWFAGSRFTAADVQMSFPVEAAAARAGLGANRPRLMDFLARIHARPAYGRALARGGEYAIVD